MDKFDYINKLSKCLEELSDEEKNAALEYYKELFEDAGSENEQELIHKLGSPEELADNIIKAELYRSKKNQKKNQHLKGYRCLMLLISRKKNRKRKSRKTRLIPFS